MVDSPVYDPLNVVTMAAFTAALAILGEWLRSRPAAAERESTVVVAALVAVAVGTLAVFLHIVRSDVSQGLLIRWDHLVFVAFAGYILARAPFTVRAWSLAILSTIYVGHTTGLGPFALVVGGTLCAFVAFCLLRTAARTIGVVKTGFLLAIWAMCWWRGTRRGLDGLSAHGLFAWLWLRHVSFVVDAPRDRPVPLGSYLCFLLFYPSCSGASEVWPEFGSRNLSGEPTVDYPGGARRIITGGLCFLAWGQIPAPREPITGAWRVWCCRRRCWSRSSGVAWS